jgi:predicted ribonuclease YlaK
LLDTRRSWLLRGMDQITARAIQQILDELEDRQRVLEAAKAELAAIRDRWLEGVMVVVDSNVFLHHPQEFDQIDWSNEVEGLAAIRLVVPLIVMEELNRQKDRGRTDDIRKGARRALRKLNDLLLAVPAGGQAQIGHETEDRRATTVETLIDPLDHEPLPVADAEIVDRALYLHDVSGHDVYVATGDSPMRFRAREAGLDVLFFDWS